MTDAQKATAYSQQLFDATQGATGVDVQWYMSRGKLRLRFSGWAARLPWRDTLKAAMKDLKRARRGRAVKVGRKS